MENLGNSPTKPKVITDNIEEQERVFRLIDFRFNQSRASRIAEYITGLRPDDPKMSERLAADQKVIRAKYGLPAWEALSENPSEYERFLRNRAVELGVVIKDKSECGVFFQEYPQAGGVQFESEKVIGATIDRTVWSAYTKSLGILEHEFIHAEQAHNSPRMPPELREYEAYVAGINRKLYLENPKDIEEFLFGFYMYASVIAFYRSENENRKEGQPGVTPLWNDPEYFLTHIDKVDPKLIEAYKARMIKRKKYA